MTQELTAEEYLEQSGYTAPEEGVEINKTSMFDGKDAAVLFEMLEVAAMGAKSDAIKRSLFYHDTNDNLNKRLTASAQMHEKMVERLMSLEGAEIEMTARDYQILHAIAGLASEAGEMLEEMINAKLDKRDYNYENLEEEGGDAYWYMALYTRAINTTIGKLWAKNIKKLKARFPNKFTTDSALNRDLENEKVAMEN